MIDTKLPTYEEYILTQRKKMRLNIWYFLTRFLDGFIFGLGMLMAFEASYKYFHIIDK